MHPLLGQGRRLGWYLAVWLPLGGLLAILMSAGAGLNPALAWAWALPLALVYAFVCLPTWYSCRVLPLRANPWRWRERTLRRRWWRAGSGWSWRGHWPGVMVPLRSPPASTWAKRCRWWGARECCCTCWQWRASTWCWERRRRTRPRAVAAAREAELRALKAQINPHFLFNSLNSISSLTGSEPARARKMCILLGDFMRQTLALGGRGERATVSLGEELALIHAFLAIEQARFGARLRFEEAIAPQALAVGVPPLLLQPLVENAVVHGIAHLLDGGWIRLEASCSGGRLRLCVANAYDPEAPRRAPGGVGLANVRARLQTVFGGRAQIEVAAREDRFQVSLELPEEVEA
ncbi:MAG TPA: histidine kinase [Terriglobales bacterium]|nr:histidine kinase [Terriglobales bacterium]